MDAENLIETELIIDSVSRFHLKETATWAKFLAITGYVFSVVIALFGLMSFTSLSDISGNYRATSEKTIAAFSTFLIFFFCCHHFYDVGLPRPFF